MSEIVEDDDGIILIDEPMRVIDMSEAARLFSCEYLQECFEKIIYETLGKVDQINMGHIQQWDEIDRAFPQNTMLILKNRKVVGYWTILPLKDDVFEKALKGNLDEGTITLESLEYVNMPGTYSCYFLDIAILPEYRGVKAFQLLINAFFELLQAYAEDDIYFKDWCANGYSVEGEMLCRSLGMHYLCDHHEEGEGKIYYIDASQFTFDRSIFKRFPRLVELYKKRFSF